MLVGQDMSRLPPRVFRKIPAAISALKTEIEGLLVKDAKGQSALKEIELRDPRFAHLPKVFTTIVIKRKSSGIFKARLVLRGDMVPIAMQQFLSAPTAARCMVRIVLSIASTMRFRVGTVDVSMAFLQADIVNPEERIVAILPSWIPLPWSGTILNNEEEKLAPPVTKGVITIRPLYGGRDAPLRWFLRISTTLRSHGWKQLRTDVCTFTKHSAAGNLVGIVEVHVDDILCAAEPPVWEEFKEMMNTFKHGEFEMLDSSEPITFLGLQLLKRPEEGLGIHQNEFIQNMTEIDTEKLIKSRTFIAPEEKRKTAFRQALGGLIWIGQTRYDLSFQITKIATSYVYAIADIDETIVLAKLVNNVIKRAKEKLVILWYHPLCSKGSSQDLVHSGKLTVFAFSDAGFATLRNSASVQSSLIIVGVPIQGDGILKCRGHHLDSSTKKISRVSRSTLASETVAISDTVDLALWYKTLLTEIYLGKFSREIVSPTSSFPLLSP